MKLATGLNNVVNYKNKDIIKNDQILLHKLIFFSKPKLFCPFTLFLSTVVVRPVDLEAVK
jgi:hypothetical protein